MTNTDNTMGPTVETLRSGGARRLANKVAKVKPSDYYDDSNISMRNLRANVNDKLAEIQKQADAKTKKAADRERNRKFRASHPRSTSMYFLNTGPDASHFANDTKIFYKLGDVKAAVKDLDHDRWVVTRRGDQTNKLSVVKAGNAAYRNAAQRYADKVNEDAEPTRVTP